MAATLTSPPRFFESLDFTRGETSEGGHVEFLAPCGCAQYRTRAVGGRLDGEWTGDNRVHICDAHCLWCETCGHMTWPHMDCDCPEFEDEVLCRLTAHMAASPCDRSVAAAIHDRMAELGMDVPERFQGPVYPRPHW